MEKIFNNKEKKIETKYENKIILDNSENGKDNIDKNKYKYKEKYEDEDIEENQNLEMDLNEK
jgi:hypothetical protein